MKLYHGSPAKNIIEFNLDSVRFESVEGKGVYLTPSYNLARGYAGAEGSVYICSIKNGAIFDATQVEEFEFLLKQASKKINFNLLNLSYIKETLQGLAEGQYQITNEQGSGINWQLKNLLYNNEDFNSLNNQEELIKILEEYIEDYLQQHQIIKYKDKSLGIIFLAKDPLMVKILQEIEVGSSLDEDFI